jgi:7-carboxy-7-deazaguanine synthase
MHEARRLEFAVMQRFLDGYDCQFKFVVDRPADFEEVGDILAKLKKVDPSRVLIMAQGTTPGQIRSKARWIVDFCKKYGYGYTPRLHIDLYGNRRGT